MSKSNLPGIGLGIVLTLAASVATRLIAISANVAIIKFLTPSQLGVFLGVQAMVLAGTGVVDLGMSHSYRQLASRDRALRPYLLGATLIVQMVAAILYFATLCYYMNLEDQLTASVALIAIGGLLAQWPDVLSIDLMIDRKYREANALELLSVVGLVIGALLAWHAIDTLLYLSIGYALGMACRALCGIIFVGTENLQVCFTRRTLQQIRLGFPFLLSLLISRFGIHFAVAYLLVEKSAYDAGIVGFAVKIYQIGLILSIAVTSVTLPQLHRLANQDSREELGVFLSRLVGPLWVATGLMCGLLVLSPDFLVSVLGSSQYRESSRLLIVIGFALLLKSLSIPAGNLLESTGKQWQRVLVQAIAAAMVIAPLLFMFDAGGPIVVVYSILCADVFSFLALWMLNIHSLRKNVHWGQHIGGGMAFLLALGVTVLSNFEGILAVLMFAVLFLSLATAFRVWDPRRTRELLIRRAV